MPTQLFLTSSVNEVAHDLVKKVDLSKGNKLVFIDTAAEPEEGDKQWLRDDRQSLVDAGFEVTDYTLTGKTSDELKAFIPQFDYIYLSGGDTLYLLKKAQESDFIELIRELVLEKGKTYIGTSAGSIIAGAKPHDYLIDKDGVLELENREGFNLVNFLIVPHWGSELFRDLYLNGRLEIAYKDDQIPMILLTDKQYVHVLGGKMEIIQV